jgi:uncharacterized protein YndB with AHSA1/START domain
MLMMLVLIAAATPESGLQPLDFLVGHCWSGELKPGVKDVHCCERAYGGQHIRDRHEVTGGYAGETLYSWDAKVGHVTYTYWNSLGGVSRGTMKPAADRLDFGDEAYVGPDGRSARLATHWQRLGADAYEAVTGSPELPSMNRTVVYRRVSAPVSMSETRLPDGGHVLAHEVVVAAPIDQVWTAIATAEGWQGWAVPFARMIDETEMETSYDPSAPVGSPATIRQRTDAAVAPRVLAFRTVKAPQGFPHFETYAQVRSAFELEPVGPDATRVRLTSSGYPDTEAGRQLRGFFREGNRISLERLQRRFVNGPIDWSKEK